MMKSIVFAFLLTNAAFAAGTSGPMAPDRTDVPTPSVNTGNTGTTGDGSTGNADMNPAETSAGSFGNMGTGITTGTDTNVSRGDVATERNGMQQTVQGSSPSIEQVREAQRSLSDNGFAVTADGVMGPKTRSAIRRFQSQEGLTVTGSLDAETLEKLEVSNGAEGQATESPSEL